MGAGNILWLNVSVITSIHALALYGLKVLLCDCKLQTALWTLLIGYVSGFGVTGGAHRLWTHRAYKAKTPLRVILAWAYLTSGMNSIFHWVRDHRVHHKFSETDADPHNAKRGLFFSHVGWLMQKKHPEVIRRGREVDMSDIMADPVVAFQERYFTILQMTLCFVVPISVPCLYWNESWWNSVMCNFTRWVLALNVVWSVNSFAHIYGNKPYNKYINPSENLAVAIAALGEGWHNYHHTFPWDYKTAELNTYSTNFTTALIDAFAYIGWAYDLKQPSAELIKKTVESSGDGTWGGNKEVPEENH